MYCGANNHAVHVQATDTTCNVTVFDINNPMSMALNPTKPCDHSIYNKTCTAFQVGPHCRTSVAHASIAQRSLSSFGH